MKNFQKIISKILIILAIFLGVLFLYLQFGWRGEEQVEENLPVATTPAPTETPEPTAEPTATPEPTEAPTPEPTQTPVPLVENPYKEYFLENKDMAGWLQIPDTNIDYPIMWTPGDEEFYLRKGFDGKYDKAGCLILDTDSKVEPATTNLIIHGHNMKAGTMFGKLEKYKDAEYGSSHNMIYLYTPETLRSYEVVAVFRSQVYKKSDTVFKFYKFFEADSQEEFLDFYNNIKELSLYDTGVTAEYGDRFITLSTCSYHVDNGRFVVVAKEVEEQHLYEPIAEGVE